MPQPQAPTRLTNNLRFYILAFSVALSALLASVLRLVIPSDQVYTIRLEQVFGLAAILYWYFALLVTPLTKIYGKTGLMAHLMFARRALGVSAAYFALLHAALSFWGQTGGPSGYKLLPQVFQFSVLLGLTALLILLVMAVTSFDKVIAAMTFPRWKWLQRLGYLAGVLAMLHVWLVSTHLAYPGVRTVSFVLLSLLFWLEARRLLIAKSRSLAILAWLAATGLLVAVPQMLPNYHEHRTQTSQEQAK